MATRRHFLQHAGLVATAPFLPSFVAKTQAGLRDSADNGRILVIVQLDGGNDGLNTVVPFGQDAYYRSRPELALPSDQIIRMSDQAGLHPSMRDASDLVNDGQFSVIQNVGYPNPNRSHFRSMAIWHTASNAHDLPRTGWAGRALDPQADGATDSLFAGTADLPLALQGRRSVATSVPPGESLQLRSGLVPQLDAATPPKSSAIHAYVRRNVLNAYCSVKELNAADKRSGQSAYPASALAQSLKAIAGFIGTDSSARVYYAIQPGYDTHEDQLGAHSRLLQEFSGSVRAFLRDLKNMKLADRVVLMAFSEFGRRVRENGSAGTDHGTAGPIFLAGSAVEPGLIGDVSNLEDLDGDDLKVHVDFRQVYATLLEQWLQIPSEVPLGRRYSTLPVLRKSHLESA